MLYPEDVERLWVEFQQLDTGPSKQHGGTGLGLALTRRLAEALGGAAYPYVVALMIASALVPMLYFRKRGWLK